MSERILCDDEEVTLDVGGVKFKSFVGTLRKCPKLAETFPETSIKMPANGVFQIGSKRDPTVFAAFLELLEKNCVPASVDEDKLQQELCFWGMPSLEDLDLEDESCDTESDSPHKQVPSNVRAAVEVRTADSRLDMRYSMRGDEMFGRAIALVRQEDMVVRVSDIQHGLALLRELLSVEKNNVAYMYYMSYGEMRLGRAAESAYWSDKVLKIDPCNLAAASLKTLINDKRKQNSLTGVLVVGGALLGVAAAWYVFSKE